MILCLVLVWPLTALANQTGQMMIASKQVEAKETTEESAGTVVVYEKGDAVFVVGEKNGWYEAVYRGKSCYIPKAALQKLTLGDMQEGTEQEAGAEQSVQKFGGEAGLQAALLEEDAAEEESQEKAGKANETEEDAGNRAYIDALDQEMKAMEAENQIVVEEVERQRAEKKNSMIWGVVIVLLVIGIFAVGILSTMRSEREKDG